MRKAGMGLGVALATVALAALAIVATSSAAHAKQAAPIETAYVARRSLRPPIPTAISASRIAKGTIRNGR